MATGTGSSRPLWLALLGIGIVVLIISGDIGGDPGAEEFDSAGESMMSTFRIAGQESSRRIVVVIGSLIVLAAGIGLFRTFSQVPDDDADPVVTRGLSGSALAGATDMAPGPERRGPPPEDRWTDDVEFDPTRWDHPAGILFVFEGRSASGFYELVQRICRERLGRSGLLVGLMQGLDQRERKLVVVLGPDRDVRHFDEAFRQFVADGSAAAEWDRVRPDLQLQKESYDPRFVIADNSDYLAVRKQLKQAGYMVLAAVET